MPSFCLFVCLLGWWACNCSITESLPELIQQVRQDLSGAQHYKKYTVPTNLWEQPIGHHHLLFPQSHIVDLLPYRIDFLLERQVYCSDKFVGTAVPIMFVGTALFPQICRNSILFKILPLGPWEASLNGNQVGNDSPPKDFYSMMLRCVVVHCVSKTFQCHLCFKTESLMCNSELCLSPPEIRNKNLKEPNLITAF